MKFPPYEVLYDPHGLFKDEKVFMPVSRNYYFRGQSDVEQDLKPSIFRCLDTDLDSRQVKDYELRVFNEYKTYVLNENWLDSKCESVDEDLFLMSIGRHLGLNCRLLDWTIDWKRALYFTAKENLDSDGALWILQTPKAPEPFRDNPFESDNVAFIPEKHWVMGSSDYNWTDETNNVHYSPIGVLKRNEQFGFFTISGYGIDLKKELNNNDFKLAKLLIPAETKPSIKGRAELELNMHYTKRSKGVLEVFIDELNTKIPKPTNSNQIIV